MSDLTAASVPVNLLTATPQGANTPGGANPPMSPAETAKRAQIHQTSQKFEASFLSVMLNEMFSKDDDNVDKAFTGGSGAKMFQAMLAESMADKMVKTGGIGLAASVQREMLKMQGLH